MRVAPPTELNKPEQIRIAGFSLMGIACMTSFLFGLWVYLHRNKDKVKARQPVFLMTFCAGTFLLALSILPVM